MIETLRDIEITIDERDIHFLTEFNWFIEKQSSGIYFSTRFTDIEGKVKTIKLHRLIAGATDIKDGKIVFNSKQVVDHIDRNPLNNNRSNLRLCTRSQNAMNSKIPKDNSSGHKGVTWDKHRKKWRVHIVVNGKQHFLGRYDTIEGAVESRKKAVTALFREYGADFERLDKEATK